jgi:Tol biopolymer transport system component
VTNTQPTWSPDGAWIAYASDRDGEFDIWKTDGTRVRRVVRNGTDPTWSPEGRRIAFVTPFTSNTSVTPGIYTTDASGTGGLRRVTSYGFEPAWSPDGRRITFAAPTGGCDRGIGIWTARADGSGATLVAESPDEFTDYVDPAWSPDGKRIAYSIPNSDQGESGIVTIPAAGGDVTPQLVTSSGSQPAWAPDGGRIVYVTTTRTGYGPLHVIDLHTLRDHQLTPMPATAPAWSPGGKRLAFSVKATDGSYDLYSVNADGSHLVRLTKPIRSSGPPGTGLDFTDTVNSWPAWSPDGSRLAFVSGRRVSNALPYVEVIAIDGSGRRTLAPGFVPTWSPDGRQLVYALPQTTGGSVEIVDVDGTNRRTLVRTQNRYPQPDWSPDGTEIAYADNENNQQRIYTVDVATGLRSLVLTGGGAPDWSHDGKRIMFRSYDSAENRSYLEVVDRDGGNRHRLLTADPTWEGLRWSPDDTRVVYASNRGTGGLYVMNADGTDARRVTDGYAPSWSPDGSSLAFETRLEIDTVPLSGGKPTRITYGGCTLVGSDGADRLDGTPNDDVICAFGGRDTISGGPGDDRILGGNDGDRILGGPGRDRIFGEDGGDSIDGGIGSDAVQAGKGDDVIIADDGEADFLDGGEGTDCAIADSHDRVVGVERRGCAR